MKTHALKLLLVPLLLFPVFIFSCSDSLTIKWDSTETSQSPRENFKLKVYVENSGSMNGYMCPGSQLKDAVYDYVSALDSYSDTASLYYINTQLIPYRDKIEAFIRDLNPTSFHLAGGSTANSDIAEMLEMILDNSNENDVSLFISDCILDVPNGDATKYFHQKKIQIKNVLTKKLNKNPNLAVEVLRLKSNFEGKYFYTHGFERLNNVKRPYFIWIIGDKDKLATLNKKVPYSEIEHGYENVFSWSTPSKVSYEISNTYGNATTKKELSLKTKGRNGKYQIKIKADLKACLQDNLLLCDSKRYSIVNKNILSFDSIKAITHPDSKYTHELNISISSNLKSYKECIVFKAPITPSWLELANEDEGKDIKSNLDKTTGIKYLIEGVADAYKNKNDLFKIEFIINKK